MKTVETAAESATVVPAFLATVPDVRGLFGLDIGCGDGGSTRKLARLGAHMHAIDSASTFICRAQATENAAPLGIVYQVANSLQLPYPADAFDFATAFLSLAEMPDHARALNEVTRILLPGGFFQFTILHPCFAPPHHRVLRDMQGNIVGVEIARSHVQANGSIDSDALHEASDGRLAWRRRSLTARAQKPVEPLRTAAFHRTLGSWVDLLCTAGLIIEKLAETAAGKAFPNATDVAPLLHIRTRKR
jgi:SAM-dependent methyltransferase